MNCQGERSEVEETVARHLHDRSTLYRGPPVSFFVMNDIYIIAKSGVNHNGSSELAHELIDVASKAGVDAIKCQTFIDIFLSSVKCFSIIVAPGPDHQASLEPDELKEMVNAIHLVGEILRDGTKAPSSSEVEHRSVSRKYLVALKSGYFHIKTMKLRSCDFQSYYPDFRTTAHWNVIATRGARRRRRSPLWRL